MANKRLNKPLKAGTRLWYIFMLVGYIFLETM